jgi:uncharacterized protein YndB with AHSA1/START domain
MEKSSITVSADSRISADRIRKEIQLRAPRARVWRALSSAAEFGTWFGARLDGAFQPGARIRGPMTTPGYDHLTLEITIERVEPERLLSFRWHPYAIDPKVDYSDEPTTLVTFEVGETAEGTLLVVTESGFEAIPPHRRAEAFRMNDGGWAQQMLRIERHLAAGERI